MLNFQHVHVEMITVIQKTVTLKAGQDEVLLTIASK